MPFSLVLVTQPYLWLSPNRVLKKKSPIIDFAYSPAVWSGVTGEGSLLLDMVSVDRFQLGTGRPTSRTTPSHSSGCHLEAQPPPSPPGPQGAWLPHSTVSGESWADAVLPFMSQPASHLVSLRSYWPHSTLWGSHKGLSRFKSRTLRSHFLIQAIGWQGSGSSHWRGNLVVEYKIHDYSCATPGMLPPRAWPLLSLCLECSSLRYSLGPYSQ